MEEFQTVLFHVCKAVLVVVTAQVKEEVVFDRGLIQICVSIHEAIEKISLLFEIYN